MYRRGLFGLVVAGALILMIVIALAGRPNNSRTITISTDTTPATIQINNSSYNLTSTSKQLSVKPGSYNYRAAASVNSQRITLSDTVDVSDNKTAAITLHFAIFNKDTIYDVLCVSTAQCPFKSDDMAVTYYENYKWAVVVINSPSIGRGYAVLKIQDGTWTVVDGPGTDIANSGLYPISVERGLVNAQQ